MESVTNFEYDIFISYAHDDDLPDTVRGKEGWVKSFCTLLKTDLKRAGCGDVRIWWDNRTLAGNDFFDGKIEEGIQKSAIFLCLNSVNYQNSEYCEKELEIFFKKAKSEKEGIKVGHSSRIINCLLKNIPFDQWPAEMQGRSGYHFYERLDEGVDWRTANILDFTDQRFNEEWKKLIAAIFKLVDGLSETNEAASIEIDEGVNDDVFTIYFADSPESLLKDRDKAISSLKKKGYKIILNNQDVRKAKEHEEATRQVLEHADLAVHLIDHSPGFGIEDEPEKWYRTKQIEIVLDSPVPQLIWMDSLVPIEGIRDDKYREYVQSIEMGSLDEKDYEFIIGDYSNLTNTILDHVTVLEEQKKSLEKKNAVDSHEELDILLDYNVEDKMYAMALEQSFQKHNLITHFAPFGNNPDKNRRILQNRLNEVKKLVFLYGKSSKEWVESRFTQAMGKLMFDKGPVEDIFIYITPPAKDAEDLIKAGNTVINNIKVNVVNHSDQENVNPEIIEDFMSNLIGKDND
ncbi:MAG: TIR domain-containing protein [Flavobacteriaceae bacterium]